MADSVRAGYGAVTSDRQIFPTLLSSLPRDSIIEAESAYYQKPSALSKVQNGWGKFATGALTTIQNNTGMLLVAASQGFFALMDTCVKTLHSLDPPVTTFELIFVRMAITWIFCVTYMSIMKIPDLFLGPKGIRLLLVLRGFFGFFGLFGLYYSLQYLSLSDATVLTFLAPICVTITAAIFLGEEFSWRQVFAASCALVGVVLVARPEFLFHQDSNDSDTPLPDNATRAMEVIGAGLDATPEQRLAAVGIALLGVCGATGAYTTIRAIGTRAHPLHNLVSFSSQCIVVSTIAIVVMRIPVVIPTKLDWIAMLLLIGVFGFFAQILLVMGLQRETAGRGTMALYVQIVFATAFERIFFRSTPPPLSIAGILIIMSSATYVAIAKNSNIASGQRAQSAINSAADTSLEEDLLENEEEHY